MYLFWHFCQCLRRKSASLNVLFSRSQRVYGCRMAPFLQDGLCPTVLRGLVGDPLGAVRLDRWVDLGNRAGKARCRRPGGLCLRARPSAEGSASGCPLRGEDAVYVEPNVVAVVDAGQVVVARVQGAVCGDGYGPPIGVDDKARTEQGGVEAAVVTEIAKAQRERSVGSERIVAQDAAVGVLAVSVAAPGRRINKAPVKGAGVEAVVCMPSTWLASWASHAAGSVKSPAVS